LTTKDLYVIVYIMRDQVDNLKQTGVT